jgi:hypothetical protein
MLDACRLARVIDAMYGWDGTCGWLRRGNTCLRVVVGFAVGYIAFVRRDGGSRGRRAVGLSCCFACHDHWFKNSDY